jgi:hypothetical protein
MLNSIILVITVYCMVLVASDENFSLIKPYYGNSKSDTSNWESLGSVIMTRNYIG